MKTTLYALLVFFIFAIIACSVSCSSKTLSKSNNQINNCPEWVKNQNYGK
jgi:hypothetical protein